MSDKPSSPLRRRMIEDMTVRNFVEKTRNDYIRHVRTFTTFLGRAPDTAAPEDLRLFQLHQTQIGVRAPSINGSVVALRFFFTVTLDRPEMARHLTFVREPRRIPAILSLEEIARLLEAAPGPKYKAALSAAYGAGLRVSEVVALKVSDIDSERMLLRIEQGKGRKDRFAMLSPRLLELLRDWYRIARPAVWLFPGRDPLLPLTTRQFNRIVHAAADRAAIKKRVTPHTLRHRLVYGPFQIEARINQNTEISQQLTLWNQMGSRVIRGANLLVIPIENSILYVSPLYLRAERGHLPELKRVIAAYGEHVVMKETLAEALSALFIEPGSAPAVSSTTAENPLTGPPASQAQEALDRYNQAVERLKPGVWKGSGRQLEERRGF